jgi:hypothetical protein
MRKMSISVVTAVAVLVLLASAREASSCERCGFRLKCDINPNCEIVTACKEVEHPNLVGYDACYETLGSCTTSPNPCQWTMSFPAGEPDWMALIEDGSNSSPLLERQCPNIVL